MEALARILCIGAILFFFTPWGCKGPPGSQGAPGTTDHGQLTGLSDDDHPQYLTYGRGDAMYAGVSHTHTSADIMLSCPSDMVPAGDFCIDKYEGSVWSSPDCTGIQFGVVGDNYPAAFPDNGNWTTPLYGCSKPGVYPSVYITWFQASQACALSGKRLCTNAEWQIAASGTPDNAGMCNTSTASAEQTDARPSCISSWGAYNMVGNVWEWVADWSQGDIDPAANGANTPLYGNDVNYGVRRAQYQGSGANMPAAIVRGGDWALGTESGVFSIGFSTAPSWVNNDITFRCCKSGH